MENSSYPIWLSVLKHFDKKYYFKNGLTIPFLIGADKLIKENSKPMSVREFLTPILNQEFETQITMLRCNGISEFVFGLIDWESKQLKNLQRKRGKELYREIGNLNIIDRSYEKYSDDEVVAKLEEEYSPKIDQEKYSKINGTWGPFSEEDINRINEIKNKASS